MSQPKTSEARIDLDAPTRELFLASLRSLERVVHGLSEGRVVELTAKEAHLLLQVGPRLPGWEAEGTHRRALKLAPITPVGFRARR